MMMKQKDWHMFMQRSRQSGLLLVAVPVFLTLLVASGCNRDPVVRKQKYLESGKRYENDGKLKEAVIQFQNALKVDHGYADAHYELAKTYLKLGAIKSGFQELMQTVAINPANLQARVDLGGLYLAGNGPDKALEQAKAVLAADSNNADAYALLSAISARKGDREGALTNIQHALAIKPNQASFHTALAMIQGSDPNGGAAAEQELNKAISLDTKDTHAHMVLAALLEKKGDRAGAEQQYLAAIQQAPAELQSRASLAGLYMRGNDNTKAEQTLRKTVEDMPDNEDAASLLKDFYFRTGKLDAAETTFAALNSRFPKSFPIKMTYANVLATRGEFDKVGPIADELGKKNAAQPHVQVLKSALLLNAGKVNDAFDLLQKGVKATPENLQLEMAFARVAEMKGDFATAETTYRSAEKIAPRDVDIQAALAQIASRRADWSMLAQVAEKTIAVRPDTPQAYLWRGMAEAGLKQFDKAETDLQTALAKDPNNGSTYTQLGQLRLTQGHIPEAVTMLEKAMEKDPNSVMALNEIAAADMYMKQPDKAVTRIQQQIARSPKNPAFYTLLSTVQLNTKDFSGARDNSKKAMEMNPEDERAVQAYAEASDKLGDKDEAIRTWAKWAGTHPKDPTAPSMLALLEDERGNTGAAIQYYKKSLEISASMGRDAGMAEGLAANNLAYLMVTTGQNPDLALSYAQTARRKLPTSPDTADTLAWVYYYKGTYMSARNLLEDALKVSPDNASMHYHLGMTYSKLGRKADAQLQLKKAISLEPNSKIGKDAATALAQLG